MNRSAEEIERDVEETRGRLEETVEALKDKMSIGQIIDEAAGYFRGNGGEAGEIVSRLADQARANPLPLALIGVGLAWLMSGRGAPNLRIRSRRRGYYDDDPKRGIVPPHLYGERFYDGRHVDDPYFTGDPGDWHASDEGDEGPSLGERLGSVARGAGHAAASAAGAAGRVGHAVGGTVSHAAHSIGERVAGAAHEVGDRVRSMRSDGNGSGGGRIRRTMHDARDAAGDMGERVGGMVRGAGGAMHRAGDAVRHVGDAVWDGSRRAYGGVRHAGVRAGRTVADVMEDEPLIIGAIGIAVGAALGAAFPSTEVEDRYLGRTRDRFKHDAEDFAREQMERGREVAREGMAAARDAFADVKEEVREAVSTVGDQVRTTAATLKEQARTVASSVKEDVAEQAKAHGFAGAGTGSSGGAPTGNRP